MSWPAILQLKVADSQLPKVAGRAVTFGCMNAPSPQRQAFRERLHELCDEMEVAARGRQRLVAEVFGVSQQAAGKWLRGEAYPELEKVLAIAEWSAVNVNWLLQGVGPKRGNRIDARALVLDEAVQSLPPALGADLIDGLRAKLVRIGKLNAAEPSGRYAVMLDAYEKDLTKNKH